MVNYYGHNIEWIPTIGKSKKAIYVQIADCIESDIKTGVLPTGFKLPSQRLIANYLGINHSTITKAYKLCEAKGLIGGIVGKGTYIKNMSGVLKTVISKEDPNVIDLAMLHPLYETNDLLTEMIDELTPYFDKEIMYKYSSASGHIKHKYIAANWLKRLNIESTPERIVITSGAQNALYTILMTVFHTGDKIAVDELTYTGLRNSAMQLGLRLIPIKSDEEGMKIDELLMGIEKLGVKGIYLIPDCHNPTTKNMSKNRRFEIADLIKKYDLIAIEESLFRFTTDLDLPTIHSLVPCSCYHIASLSKMINPGFRIAYLLLSERANYENIEHNLHNLLFMPSSITAEMLSCLQSSNKLDDFLEIRKSQLINRNMIFDRVFKDMKVARNSQPMFRFIELPIEKVRAVDLEKEFLVAGVRIYSADRFRTSNLIGPEGIRVSISSSETYVKLEEALNLVKRIIMDRII